MNLLCRIGLHDWKNVYGCYTTTFLGEELKKYSLKFRVCDRCYKAQEYCDDFWRTLSEEEKEILSKKIFINKDGRYVLWNCVDND